MPTESPSTTKAELRTVVSARRSQLSVADREAAAHAIAAHLGVNPFGWGRGHLIGAYVPFGTEPGSTEMLDALSALGATVVLPVVPAGPPAPLTWVPYTGVESLERRRWGLLEPTGTPLPATTITDAAALLIPALALSRKGIRLGRGAGYYDRTLGWASPSTRLIGVVNDDELLAIVPGDDHDIPMGWALTPGAGFTQLTPGVRLTPQ